MAEDGMWSSRALDYVCNGVRIRSAIPLSYPPADPGAADPEVSIVPGAVTVPAPGLPEGRDADFFVDRGSLILAVRGVGRWQATGGSTIVVDPEPGAKADDIRLYLSGSVLGAIWLQRGSLPLHASTVRVGEGCVGFVGPSGAGKSSLAAHFAAAGHSLVADDVSVLARTPSGIAVWPGPARVKLAPDALESLARDPSDLRHTGGTREKYHLELGARPEPTPVPLLGVFLLSYGAGAPSINRMRGLDALDTIAGHTYRQEFVRPLGLEKQWLRQVAEVARFVPTSRLIRPSGYERSGEVIDAVLAAVADYSKEERKP